MVKSTKINNRKFANLLTKIQIHQNTVAHSSNIFTSPKQQHHHKERASKNKKKERTYEAIIINGEDILFLRNHVAKAPASRVLKRNARSFRTQNAVDIISIVEFIVKTLGDLDCLRRIAILHNDQMVWLKKWPPHL